VQNDEGVTTYQFQYQPEGSEYDKTFPVLVTIKLTKNNQEENFSFEIYP